MAIIFADSFQQYDLGFSFRQEHWEAYGGQSIGLNSQINGGANGAFPDSQAVNNVGSAFFISNAYFPNVIDGTESEYIVQFMVKPSTDNNTLIRFVEGGTVHINVDWQDDGELTIERNGTILGTSAKGVLPDEQWSHFQIRAKVHDTTGACRILCNGTEVLNLTSQDTRNGGTGIIDGIEWRMGDCEISDLVIMDINGGSMDDITTNALRVRTLRPDATGNDADFTGVGSATNWQNVDAGYTSTIHNDSETVNHQDLFNLPSITTDVNTIRAVIPFVVADKDSADPRSIACLIDSNATEGQGSNESLILSGWRYRFSVFDEDPDTTAAWTESAVNALQAGYKVTV